MLSMELCLFFSRHSHNGNCILSSWNLCQAWNLEIFICELKADDLVLAWMYLSLGIQISLFKVLIYFFLLNISLYLIMYGVIMLWFSFIPLRMGEEMVGGCENNSINCKLI